MSKFIALYTNQKVSINGLKVVADTLDCWVYYYTKNNKWIVNRKNNFHDLRTHRKDIHDLVIMKNKYGYNIILLEVKLYDNSCEIDELLRIYACCDEFIQTLDNTFKEYYNYIKCEIETKDFDKYKEDLICFYVKKPKYIHDGVWFNSNYHRWN